MSKKCSLQEGLFEIMWSVLDQTIAKKKTKNIELDDIKALEEIIDLILEARYRQIDIER